MSSENRKIWEIALKHTKSFLPLPELIEHESHSRIFYATLLETIPVVEAKVGTPAYLSFNKTTRKFYIAIDLDEMEKIIDLDEAVKNVGINFSQYFDETGKKIYVAKLILRYVVKHELLHYALFHWAENIRSRENPILANIAQDAVINFMLHEDIELLHGIIKPVPVEEYIFKEDTKNKDEKKDEKAAYVPILTHKKELSEVFSIVDPALPYIDNNLDEEEEEKEDNDEEDLEDIPDEWFDYEDTEPNSFSENWEMVYDRLKGMLVKATGIKMVLILHTDFFGYEKLETMDSQVMDAVVKGIKAAYEKAKRRGFVLGNLERIIDAYYSLKLKRKWRKVIRSELQKISELDFNATMKKPGRRIKFPPAIKLRYIRNNAVLVLVDVSGSMEDEDLQKIFSELYGASRRYNIELLIYAYDYGIQQNVDIKDIRKGIFKVKGGGGTSVNEAVIETLKNSKEFANDFKMVKTVIIMTDGIDDPPSPKVFENKRLLLIFTEKPSKDYVAEVKRTFGKNFIDYAML